MASDLTRRRTAAVLTLLVALWCLAVQGVTATSAHASVNAPQDTHASYGPDSGRPPPRKWQGQQTGVDTKGNYCLLYADDSCRPFTPDERPRSDQECSDSASGAGPCDDAVRKSTEERKLQEWRDKASPSAPGHQKLEAFLASCVDRGETFQACYAKGTKKYPPAADQSKDWVAGKLSEAASDALQETAGYIGTAVVWLLEEFSDVFSISSAIDLNTPGVSNIAGIATALSAVIATFLLLLQFGRVSLSRQGGPAATAILGLAKWAVISSVYFIAVQTALTWSDAVSTWIVNYTFQDGGSGKKNAADAMRDQLGGMFGGLTTSSPQGSLIKGDTVNPPAVGVVIVVGIVCILAIGALWVQILLRQAAILVLVATMPAVLAGQVSDSTRTWWPRARDALIVLVLLKPVIVVCFSIGFFAMRPGSGVQNMIVGLVIFLMACAAWPVLAKAVTPARLSAGVQLTGGLLGSLGIGNPGSAHRPQATGAGAVGGGSAYTRALEQEITPTSSDTGAAANPAKKTFWTSDLREATSRSTRRRTSATPSRARAGARVGDGAKGAAGTPRPGTQPVAGPSDSRQAADAAPAASTKEA
ncbi:hypothetical protein ACFRAO_42830 [Streptomyces sp. NPDC056656]|uniref:hypothetical protein n=1 Tax=Streptomyces sp. NPDC056656 TaxID=3345895 RepID=UPI003676F566